MIYLVAVKEIRKPHFGHFIRWKRLSRAKGKTLKAFADIAGITDRTLSNIEKAETPDGLNETTLYGLAAACEMSKDGLLEAWKTTPVPEPKFKDVRNRGMFRTIKIPKDAYEGLEYLAKQGGRTVEEYLIQHAKGATIRIKKPIPGEDPQPDESRSRSEHQTPQGAH